MSVAKYAVLVVAVIMAFVLGCGKGKATGGNNTTSAEGPKIKEFSYVGKNEQGYHNYRHDQTGMIFILIPGGAFKMGSEDGCENEKPRHEVKLDGFMISKYVVTQAVWQKVMRSEAGSRPEAGGDNASNFEGDENPVERVSWNDCQEFCKKTGLRLPTEAEWEYACRAGTTTKYYWGDEPDGDYMWYLDNSGEKTHPVGQKKPNGFGLYDMIGNVLQWCQDWYGEGYYKTSPHDNPTGPETGEYRILRGGGWYNVDSRCRSALRFTDTPVSRNDDIGCRVVVGLK